MYISIYIYTHANMHASTLDTCNTFCRMTLFKNTQKPSQHMRTEKTCAPTLSVVFQDI